MNFFSQGLCLLFRSTETYCIMRVFIFVEQHPESDWPILSKSAVGIDRSRFPKSCLSETISFLQNGHFPTFSLVEGPSLYLELKLV